MNLQFYNGKTVYLKIQDITNQISTWIILVPALIGCSIYTNLAPKSKIIFFMVLAACVPQMAYAFRDLIVDGNILLKSQMDSLRNSLYNFNIAFELVLLFLFFRKRFHSKKRNQFFRISALGCMLLGIVLLLENGISEKFLVRWLVVNNFIYTTWILMLLLDLYQSDSKDADIITAPFLVYIFGLFFYTSCTIIYFPLRENIETLSYLVNLGIIHDVFNTFLYVAFALGFVMEAGNRKIKIINADVR